MAGNKEPQQDYPLAPANGFARSDQESASANSKELRKKKRMKCLLYIFLFAVFQTGIIVLFTLTIMKFRNPKFRVRSASFEPLGNITNSINISLNAELGVKNTNFGHYKYQNTTIDFYYRDIKVGEAMVERARARARSTRKFNISVNLADTQLVASDISSGILPLTAQARLRGKVTIMFIMKKNKNANMNCTMQANIQTREIQDLICT